MATEEVTETPEEVEATPLEDIEVSLDDIADGNEEEVETESEKDESTETEEEAEVEEEVNDQDQTDEKEEPKEEEESQLSDEDKQKQHNREMAAKRIQEKQQREAEIKKQQDEYVAEAGDDPTLTAVRQLQVDAYRTKVDTNEGKLKNSYEKALNDFPILREDSPEIQAELDEALDSFQARFVTIDQWGNPSDVRGDLYEALKVKANSIERLTAIGAKKQEGNKTKAKANSLTPPSKTPKTPKSDPDMDAFNEEAYGKK